MTVGVVGLGFAGLRAATLLKERGAHVRLFEARSRIGGRCRTIEDDGLVYEAGGEWIDADHHRVLALLREHGRSPLVPGDWPRMLLHKGSVCDELTLWEDALEDDLRVEGALQEGVRGLRLPHWVNRGKEGSDARSVMDFLRENTASERGLWWQTSKWRSDEGEDLDRISLLGWLANGLLYADREGGELSAFRIPGGSSSLMREMLAATGAEPQFNRSLVRVARDGFGVTLGFEDGGSERVDRAILTLPPPALERVVFDPPLSAEKRCAVEGVGMGRAVKIAWTFSRAWWLDRNWGGSLQCDLPFQQTWDSTLGEVPVLQAYVCGEESVRFSRSPDPVGESLAMLAEVFPEARETFVRGRFHDWPNDPFAGGAFSYLPCGYVLSDMAGIAPAEGPVHFAGEHTAIWQGFIEGALESAERVVGEIG